MARVIGSRINVSVSLLQDKKLSRAAKRKADSRISKSLDATSDKHYRHAIQQVASTMANGTETGLGSINSSSSKRISFKDVDGGVRNIVTSPWVRLNKAYLKRKPASTQFWRKTGRLSAAANRVASSSSANALVSKSQVVRSHHKGKETIKYKIKLSRLRYPFDELLRQAFISSTETPISSVQGKGRRGLSRAYWAERYRPFISRMSASLGKRYLTALRKIKIKQ